MKKLLAIILLATASMLLTSCATTGGKGFKTIDYLEYATAEPTVTQGDVTMTCRPLSREVMSDYPELFAFVPELIPADLAQKDVKHFHETDASGKAWAYTFGVGSRNLTAAVMKVENGTDHILRMGDARIYLRIDGVDPIKPYTILGDTRLIPTMVNNEQKMLPAAWTRTEGLVGWITNAEMEYEANRKKGLIEFYHYPIGLRSQVIAQNRRGYKLISDVDLEILPGDSYTGLLLFPAEVELVDAVIKFYDITTKTDMAGNPTEKVSFEFPLECTRIQKWFDETTKAWVDGAPPTPTN